MQDLLFTNGVKLNGANYATAKIIQQNHLVKGSSH